MVERARLESEYTGNRIGGSNPLSPPASETLATYSRKCQISIVKLVCAKEKRSVTDVDVPLSTIKYLSSIALFLVIAACSNTEEEARQTLWTLSDRYEKASLLEFRITEAWFDE